MKIQLNGSVPDAPTAGTIWKTPDGEAYFAAGTPLRLYKIDSGMIWSSQSLNGSRDPSYFTYVGRLEVVV